MLLLVLVQWMLRWYLHGLVLHFGHLRQGIHRPDRVLRRERRVLEHGGQRVPGQLTEMAGLQDGHTAARDGRTLGHGAATDADSAAVGGGTPGARSQYGRGQRWMRQWINARSSATSATEFAGESVDVILGILVVTPEVEYDLRMRGPGRGSYRGLHRRGQHLRRWRRIHQQLIRNGVLGGDVLLNFRLQLTGNILHAESRKLRGVL